MPVGARSGGWRHGRPRAGRRDPALRGRVALRDQEIGQPKQQAQAGSVLGQPPIAHLSVAEVALHIEKGMLDLCSDRRLAPLRLRGCAARGQPPPLPGSHGHLPVHRPAPGLRAPLHAQIAGVPPDLRPSRPWPASAAGWP